MKLNFSFKNKEASFEADVEGLVEKSIENNQRFIIAPPMEIRQ